MSFQTCHLCGSSSTMNYCWRHQAPRICQGLHMNYARTEQGHMQSPLCQVCRQNPALIACFDENMMFCYICFRTYNTCVSANHSLNVIPFSYHTACRGLNRLPIIQSVGGGRDGGHGRGRRPRGRHSHVVGPDLELRLGAGPPRPPYQAGGQHQVAGINRSFYLVVGLQSTIGSVHVRNFGGELIVRTRPQLSMIGSDIVGIQVLADEQTKIQEMLIASSLAEVKRNTTLKKEISVLELMAMMDSAKESLIKILVQGDFSEYLADQSMHFTTRLADMLSEFSDDLQAQSKVTEFLMDEIEVLSKCECLVIPRSVFLDILSRYVDDIHTKPVDFIRVIWDYIGQVFISVITKYSVTFSEIQGSIKEAGEKLIIKMKEQSVEQVIKILEMEKLSDYTCNPEYMKKDWSLKTATQASFLHAVLHDKEDPEYFELDGFGNVQISHLRKYQAHLLEQAFNMKLRILSYWPIVLQRLVDNLGMHLQLSVRYLVNTQFKSEIVAKMLAPRGGGVVERKLLGIGDQDEEQFPALEGV